MTTKTTTKKSPLEHLAEGASNHLKACARNAYNDQKQTSIDSDQITELLPMVHKIVQRVVSYIKPPLTNEDLVSAGTVGLVKAAHDYDPSHQAEFKTYAYIRIRGAILDELRNFSLLPADVDKQIREATQASIEIANKTGAAPTEEQLAQKLQVSVEKVNITIKNARVKHFISMESNREDTPSLAATLASATAAPGQQIEHAELISKLTEAIQQLSERQRRIIVLYYQQELTMKQIAEVFRITEPRVSQLHATALFNLSVKLRHLKDGK